MADFPLPKFHYQVEWGGASGAFTEVSGLTTEFEALEYRNGLMKQTFKISRPGMQKAPPELTLKRGFFHGDEDFFSWMETVRGPGNVELRNVTISLMDEDGNPKVVWKVANAWPSKLEGTDLGADKNEIAVETLTLRHEGFTVEHV